YDTTGDVTALQTTVNVDQGKPFIPPRSSDRDSDSLTARQEDLGVKVVPPWVRFLIATVDVQGGKERHFVVQVQGFGPDLQSVIIDRFKIEKSRRENEEKPGAFVRVHPGAYEEDWDLLIEKVIAKTYPIDDDSGRVMPILRVGCDSNGEDGVTNNAYAFYRRLKRDGLHRRFCLIKGASQKAAVLIEKRTPDNSGRKDRKAKALGDVPVWFINTDRMKDIASASLNRATPGPRFVRFPQWLPQSFFDELMAEERDVTGHWEKITARNESFDLLTYAWAMVHQLKAEKIHDWCNNVPLWAETIDSNPEVIAVSEAGDGPAPKPARRRRRSS
ncbi:MAG: terminase gpA endonuclease subunit, partial [Aeromonas veronii]